MKSQYSLLQHGRRQESTASQAGTLAGFQKPYFVSSTEPEYLLSDSVLLCTLHLMGW